MKILKTLKRIKKLSVVTLALVSATAVQAQDRMAALAPTDVKMKSVDTLMLHNLRRRENIQAPATSLYSEWSNKSVGQFNEEIPEKYVVDLRHFAMPTPSRIVTSPYGRRWGRMHKGLDIKVYTGDTISSAFDGKVRIVKYEANGYGNYVVIRHNNGLETVYGHLSKTCVIENQRVKAGQCIGLGGNTGRSTGSHLHFETRLLGIAINPALMFDFANQDVTADTYVFRRSEHVAQTGATRSTASAKTTTVKKTTIEPVAAAPKAANKPVAAPVAEVSAAPASRGGVHRVKAGDTLYSIATKNGMTVEELCRKNGIPTSYSIKPGENLKLN